MVDFDLRYTGSKSGFERRHSGFHIDEEGLKSPLLNIEGLCGRINTSEEIILEKGLISAEYRKKKEGCTYNITFWGIIAEVAYECAVE